MLLCSITVEKAGYATGWMRVADDDERRKDEVEGDEQDVAIKKVYLYKMVVVKIYK